MFKENQRAYIKDIYMLDVEGIRIVSDLIVIEA